MHSERCELPSKSQLAVGIYAQAFAYCVHFATIRSAIDLLSFDLWLTAKFVIFIAEGFGTARSKARLKYQVFLNRKIKDSSKTNGNALLRRF